MQSCILKNLTAINTYKTNSIKYHINSHRWIFPLFRRLRFPATDGILQVSIFWKSTECLDQTQVKKHKQAIVYENRCIYQIMWLNINQLINQHCSTLPNEMMTQEVQALGCWWKQFTLYMSWLLFWIRSGHSLWQKFCFFMKLTHTQVWWKRMYEARIKTVFLLFKS